MVTKHDVLALLADGPEHPSQLSEWLQLDPAAILSLLDRMDIPRCEQCRRCFVPSMRGTTRYCSRDCDQMETARPRSIGAADMATAARVGRQPTEVNGGHSRRSRRDGRDVEFDVIWNGVGPLPGAGAAAGLGSTLSGIHHFSVGKRV